eukprot:jgi/Tetstr1/421375/TSEL_012344.t1
MRVQWTGSAGIIYPSARVVAAMSACMDPLALAMPSARSTRTGAPATTSRQRPATSRPAAWAGYYAEETTEDAIIRPRTITLLPDLLELREVWKPGRNSDSARLELIDVKAARMKHDV